MNRDDVNMNEVLERGDDIIGIEPARSGERRGEYMSVMLQDRTESKKDMTTDR